MLVKEYGSLTRKEHGFGISKKMAELPDYYMDLGMDPKASQREIEKVYRKRVAQTAEFEGRGRAGGVGRSRSRVRCPSRSPEHSIYDARLKAEDDQGRQEGRGDERVSPKPPSPG